LNAERMPLPPEPSGGPWLESDRVRGIDRVWPALASDRPAWRAATGDDENYVFAIAL
jgi:hypothetical protein